MIELAARQHIDRATARYGGAAADKALVAAKHAADAAGRRYASAEQARLLERVLELWELVPGAAGLLGTGHLDLLEETGHVQIDAGDHMRALKLSKAALADLDPETEPVRAARLLVRCGKLLHNAGKSNGATEAREAYQEARCSRGTASCSEVDQWSRATVRGGSTRPGIVSTVSMASRALRQQHKLAAW